jgi:DNA end-binding protein Ku
MNGSPRHVDEYRKALEKVIEEKIESGGEVKAKPTRKVKPTNVIDLVSVLQKSLDESGGKEEIEAPRAPARKSRRKAA